MAIVTPVDVAELTALLSGCPYIRARDLVLRGFRFGFDIGFRGLGFPTRPRNLRSARAAPHAVSTAIALELQRGHIAGPFVCSPLPCLHCSPLGAASKPSGAARLILDLSSPRGRAVNEGIDPDLYSVQYSSFDDAVRLVASVGPRASLAKLDIRHAFRICPVRLDQIHLLGFQWDGFLFVDTRLPFGSRSSPFLFNTFADLLAWALVTVCGVSALLHYLDDFFFCASSELSCRRDMDIFLCTCSRLGVPIAHDKTVGPASSLTYLGIELDAARQVARLPAGKLAALATLLEEWAGRVSCTKRDLLSLIGSLSFAARVVRPGRLFLRRLITLSTSVPALDAIIPLHGDALADIDWWRQFIRDWNGVELFPRYRLSSADLHLATDASAVGLGAVYGTSWFSEPLPSRLRCHHINVLELFAILAAVFTWGDAWRDSAVRLHTDNEAVVYVWRRGSSRDPHMLTLLRALFFFCARRNIHLTFAHVPGVCNDVADSLSRLQVSRFRRLRPDSELLPTSVPEDAWIVL